jgi:hypothetical protein
MTKIAWTGTDNHLNVADVDGANNTSNKRTSGETSHFSPAISEDKIAWTGTDNHLNVADVHPNNDISNKRTSGETSNVGPSLVQ